MLLSHGAKYRSLLPSLALIAHLIDSGEAGTGGPVSRAAAERAVAWGEYLQGHARPSTRARASPTWLGSRPRCWRRSIIPSEMMVGFTVPS